MFSNLNDQFVYAKAIRKMVPRLLTIDHEHDRVIT